MARFFRNLTKSLIVTAALAALAAAPARSAAPLFFDTARPLEKPDLSGLTALRFLTEDDYPPFNFLAADGRLAGFNIDLARALCAELALTCTIQRRRFDLLLPALAAHEGDAVVAALAMNAQTRAKADFTAPYLTLPGRFVLRRDSVLKGVTPVDLDDRSIAVVAGSSHEAFLKKFYPRARAMPYDDAAQARKALETGRVHALFGDAVSLSYWLAGADSKGCCAFRGGPFTDPQYFGDGVAIAVGKGADPLRRALDYALARLARKGRLSEIYLKYFPVGPF